VEGRGGTIPARGGSPLDDPERGNRRWVSGMSFEWPPFSFRDDQEPRNQLRGETRVEAEVEPDASEQQRTLVGIPAFNEADSIGEVVRATRRYTDEVVVVDDGSTDGTKSIARDAGAIVIEHPTNRGYGTALMTLFEEASERDATALVTLDADGQHRTADVTKLLERLQSTDADIVFGSRFLEESHSDPPLYRRFGIYRINVSTNLSLCAIGRGSWLSDPQSGFRAYSRPVIESIVQDNTIGEGMAASLDIIYHARRNQFWIDEVAISVDYHMDDTSTRNPIGHGLELMANIVRNVILR
jgi:glycosyltransferase involved in cell wall biosynthesis